MSLVGLRRRLTHVQDSCHDTRATRVTSSANGNVNKHHRKDGGCKTGEETFCHEDTVGGTALVYALSKI